MFASFKTLSFVFLLLVTAARGDTLVQGRDPVGSTVTASPVVIGGVDLDGKARRLKLGTDGSLVTSASGDAILVNSAAYEASHVLKGSAGTLIAVVGYNSGPEQFIQVHNAVSLPANGSIPVLPFKVAAASNFSLTIPLTGMPLNTGVVICNSSTGSTKTLGAADCWFTAVVR